MSYVKIQDFGTCMRKDQSINSAFAYTELQDAFLHGNKFDPMGTSSRRLMTNKCALKWTPDCDTFYRPWINDKLIDQTDGTMTDSEGMLIKQAAVMRFCRPLGCEQTRQLVDPTTLDSPSYVVDTTPCQYVCDNYDPKTIDQDPLFNRVLMRPTENLTLLKNMYNTAKRKNINISGTKLAKFFEIYSQ